jgi:hypothetical protein
MPDAATTALERLSVRPLSPATWDGSPSWSSATTASTGAVGAPAFTPPTSEAQGRFLFSGTVELLEQHGFTRIRQVGKRAWMSAVRSPPPD